MCVHARSCTCVRACVCMRAQEASWGDSILLGKPLACNLARTRLYTHSGRTVTWDPCNFHTQWEVNFKATLLELLGLILKRSWNVRRKKKSNERSPLFSIFVGLSVALAFVSAHIVFVLSAGETTKSSSWVGSLQHVAPSSHRCLKTSHRRKISKYLDFLVKS